MKCIMFAMCLAVIHTTAEFSYIEAEIFGNACFNLHTLALKCGR